MEPHLREAPSLRLFSRIAQVKRVERVLAAIAGVALLAACGSTTTTVRTTVVPIGPTAFATIPPVQPTNPAEQTTLPPDAYGEEQTYTIKSGDAPISVAASYGISLADLIAYNGWISASEFPLPGTEIKIPPNATSGGNSTQNTTATGETLPANSGCASRPAGLYKVASGDSLSRIASKFCVKMSSLLAANGWADTSQVIYPGMTIAIPPANT